MQDVFVARQPVFNKRFEVVGYELLFRDAAVDQARAVDGNQATTEVILNTFIDIGLDTIVDGKLAFINCTRDVLLRNQVSALPPDRVVIEILEDTTADAPLTESLERLTRRGFQFALDDYAAQEHLKGLLPLVDIVKVDVQAVERADLRATLGKIRRATKGREPRLLAEKIETGDDFQRCARLGFDLFQGYFFCRPNIVTGKRSPTSNLSALPLLAKLQEAEPDLDDLEDIIKRDVTLSYKLMRLINSAYFARPKPVESIRHAILLLGVRYVTSWASVIALSNIDNKPRELVISALVRAKMCELLAKALNEPNAESFFTVGLFSVLDVLLDSPLDEVLDELPLADVIKDALVSGNGPRGKVLRATVAYEKADWSALDQLGLNPSEITCAYVQAIAWTNRIGRTLES